MIRLSFSRMQTRQIDAAVFSRLLFTGQGCGCAKRFIIVESLFERPLCLVRVAPSWDSLLTHMQDSSWPAANKQKSMSDYLLNPPLFRNHRNELGLCVRRLGLPTDLMPLELKPGKSDVIPSTSLVKRSPSQVGAPVRPNHSTSSCSAALTRISGFPLYISIRPVI